MMAASEDVVIVGAGPVGLFLACELRLLGADPLVVERLPEPTGLSKALGIQGRGVDLLELRGLLPRFEAEAKPLTGFAHFGGIPLDVARLSGRPPRILFIQQARTEALLAARAQELGVRIERSQDLESLEQDEDGVTVHLRGPEGVRAVRARFLVGCDGGRSTVRTLAEIPFPGTDPTLLLRIGDVKMPGGSPSVARAHSLGIGVPLGEGYFRVTTSESYPPNFDRDASMTLDELRESVRRTFGVGVELAEPRWLSRFTNASHQAAQYRERRVFLAGDAAHTHLPAGGPGLSTGLNDAANLGWKLAASLQGWAPEGLLDTYHVERHPVGARVLLHTRAQGVLMGPGSHVSALRQVLAEVFQTEAAVRVLTDLVQGVDVRYPVNAELAHPLVGTWLPRELLGVPDAAAAFHRGAAVLFAHEALPVAAASWGNRVVRVPWPSGFGDGEQALLVRPDGHVACVLETHDAAARTRLERVLRTWFAPPSGPLGG